MRSEHNLGFAEHMKNSIWVSALTPPYRFMCRARNHLIWWLLLQPLDNCNIQPPCCSDQHLHIYCRCQVLSYFLQLNNREAPELPHSKQHTEVFTSNALLYSFIKVRRYRQKHYFHALTNFQIWGYFASSTYLLSEQWKQMVENPPISGYFTFVFFCW